MLPQDPEQAFQDLKRIGRKQANTVDGVLIQGCAEILIHALRAAKAKAHIDNAAHQKLREAQQRAADELGPNVGVEFG